MKSFSFMRYKMLFFGISLLILLPGIFSLLRWRLRLSIDFTGGTLLEVTNVSKTVVEIQELSKRQNVEISSIQQAGEKDYLLRFKELKIEQKNKFVLELGKEVKEIRYESVGPVIGKELTQKAIISILLASLFIVGYVAWAFRKIPPPYKSWKFGASAVAALVHDIFVVLGIFSIFGHYYHVEIDALFVTAMLTIIGFSVHDTIVVFDRIRENLPKMMDKSFADVVDFSISETLVRSLNTSLTVTLTLVALLLFGGESIRWFVMALLVGIVSGTYSSIFNAAPILVIWESKKSV